VIAHCLLRDPLELEWPWAEVRPRSGSPLDASAPAKLSAKPDDETV
jgi:hypothetical protein